MMKPLTKLSFEEWLATAALLFVMGAGFWQAIASLNSPAVRETTFSFADFKEGRATSALSTQLDKNLPLRNELIAWANAGRYWVTRGAGDQVRLGQDDWLFSVEELQYFPQARAHENARIATLTQAASALKDRGVSLVIAVVPDKSRMVSHKLARGRYPDWNADRYGFIVDSLRLKGVQVVDLRSALTSDNAESYLYYRTDTHWNQAGAKRAAQAIAAQIKLLAPDLPRATFYTQSAPASSQRPGDLMRMMGLGDMPNWARPKPDVEAQDSTKKIESPQQPAGLFDAVTVPVVLVGTSYSLRGNFHGYLQQALGAEVLNVARDGGGFIQAAKSYLADESFQTSKPQVIVWEVPERVFSPTLTDAEEKGIAF